MTGRSGDVLDQVEARLATEAVGRSLAAGEDNESYGDEHLYPEANGHLRRSTDRRALHRYAALRLATAALTIGRHLDYRDR